MDTTRTAQMVVADSVAVNVLHMGVAVLVHTWDTHESLVLLSL